jgi:hypothetical protein
MTIERISFPEGVVIEDAGPADLARVISEGLASGQGTVQRLPVGEHDVTPKIWTKHLQTRKVLVHPDGTGTLRSMPRDSEVGAVDLQSGEYKHGGTVINLPQDEKVAIIAGPKKDFPKLHVFEVIYHR